MATLTAVLNELQPDPEAASDLQVIFVSLDPQRDSPEVLGNYMEYFGGGFLGVTGSDQEINGLVGQFGAGYVMEPAVIPGEYLISQGRKVGLVIVRLFRPFDTNSASSLFSPAFSISIYEYPQTRFLLNFI